MNDPRFQAAEALDELARAELKTLYEFRTAQNAVLAEQEVHQLEGDTVWTKRDSPVRVPSNVLIPKDTPGPAGPGPEYENGAAACQRRASLVP